MGRDVGVCDSGVFGVGDFEPVGDPSDHVDGDGVAYHAVFGRVGQGRVEVEPVVWKALQAQCFRGGESTHGPMMQDVATVSAPACCWVVYGICQV